ncbi:MAG: hypothetical protein HQM08_30615 [Candidatus Riflebacteria bacterium]|nr:hypothetical protein [Candidatus Riflebacteria bacterium]
MNEPQTATNVNPIGAEIKTTDGGSASLPKFEEKSNSCRLGDYARVLPYCFVAFVGTIYAAGFLVVETFLEHLGIREAGPKF